MDKKIEHIEFEYVDGVTKSPEKEAAAANDINRWFNPFIDEINNEQGKVVVTFEEEYFRSLKFENMSADLRKRANEEFNRFRTQKF